MCIDAYLVIGCEFGANKTSRNVAWQTNLRRGKCVNYIQSHALVPQLKAYDVYVVMSSNNDYDVYRAYRSPSEPFVL